MLRRYRSSSVALGVALALYGGASSGQEAPRETEEIEVITVTGSYIEGGAEDAALPIDVTTIDDLLKQGSPTMVEFAKSLPASQGVFGDSNQFTAGQSTGSANVNLRGLGAQRTLVLLNGRRLAPNPAQGVGVDINLLPLGALERIEVLKDGAAATYGSDAIGGVVNFITRKSFDGLQLDSSYSYIQDSDGDYGANMLYGWGTDTTNVLLAAGYRHRSELNVRDRDWALRPYAENPSGGWTSFGSPGAYLAGTTRFVDPQCANLEGTLAGTVGGVINSPIVGAGTPSTCQFQYTQFDNLVEREEHYQAFTELTHNFGETTALHAELLYARHDVPEENSSPSYGPNQGPAGGSPSYFIPIANPGFAALLPQLPQTITDAITAGGGAGTSGLFWRPLGAGGNPLTGEGKQDERLFDTYRAAIDLSGEFGNGTNWTTGVTYSSTTGDLTTPDIVVARLDLALRGLGGPNCTGTTPGANNCLWFNPFSTGVQQHAITGAVNPQFDPNAANSRDVIDWMFEDFAYQLRQTLFSVDAVFNGETGINLPGGAIAWATGAQYRENGYERDPNDISDINLFPCAGSILDPSTTCVDASGKSTGTGVLSFNGSLGQYDLTQDLYAVFAELSLPITESLQAQVAVRYEDYGGGIGDTTDPKLALRWQVADFLVLRGSASTTFRAPPATQTAPGFFVGSAFTPAAAGYKPYRTNANPNLKPETATTFNVGAIVTTGAFRGSLDFWSYDFKDSIETESGNDLINRFFQGGSGCTNPALQGLRNRITFNNNNTCSTAANIVITDINFINGSDATLSGIDTSLQYTFDAVLGGELLLGFDGTYNVEYDQDANVIEGIVVRAAADYVGTRGTNGSLPRWKGTAFAEYSMNNHDVRVAAHYVGKMSDTRVTNSTTAFSNINPGSPGAVVDSFLTFDLVYNVQLPWDTSLSAAVLNVTDEDPPFARLDLNYDTFSGNPLGRVVKLGFIKFMQ